MLEAELGRATVDEFLKSEKLKDVGRKLNLSDPNDILAAVGYGDLSVAQVVNRLREQEQHERIAKKGYAVSPAQDSRPSNVGSLGGLLHHLAKCCQPVPGEEIEGVVTRGSGIAVHRKDCLNLMKADAERRMTVDWALERQTTYPAGLQVETIDRVGVAGDVLKKISDLKINLRDLRVETSTEKKTAHISVIIDVVDINQLNRVSQAISQISDVVRVQRKDHRRKLSTSTTKPSNVTPLNTQRKRNGGTNSSRRELKLE
jgi:GTP diphosphokinase / guanosine-3',5'-bis(diphosphate) 3'-diphosphatase